MLSVSCSTKKIATDLPKNRLGLLREHWSGYRGGYVSVTNVENYDDYTVVQLELVGRTFPYTARVICDHGVGLGCCYKGSVCKSELLNSLEGDAKVAVEKFLGKKEWEEANDFQYCPDDKVLTFSFEGFGWNVSMCLECNRDLCADVHHQTCTC